jgi:aspartyl protease family protein
MTMDFMRRFLRRAFDGNRSLMRNVCLTVACWPLIACGADVGLAGLFPGKTLLTINGGAPRIVAVGATTSEGVKVVSVDGDTATLEIDGKKRMLRVGQNVAAQPSGEGPEKVVLTADTQGHFLTTGTINGTPVRFMVDTGATLISIGAGDARRIGIDPSKGIQGVTSTANGQIRVSRVKLDTVRLGNVTVYNIDAAVLPHELTPALLGMSFLNRMEMQRSAGTMTLIKRY